MAEHRRRPRTRPTPLAAVAELVGGRAEQPEVAVTGLTLDSRQVEPGDLFAALPGEHWHGARFAGAAVAAGAAAVLTDREGRGLLAGLDVAVLEVTDPRRHLGAVASLVYGHPAHDLLVLGVTGTNGKTTTTWLIESALRAAGHRTGLIGTVETRIGDDVLPSTRTTPEAPELHALLAVMREAGVTAVAMEVSSHALALGRVDGLVLDVAGFTQLGRDHLDLHGDEEAYFAAKASLFTAQHARRAVVTVDDVAGRRLAAQAQVPVMRLSASGATDADARVVQARPRPTVGFEVDLQVLTDGALTDSALTDSALTDSAPTRLDLHFTVGLPGRFNVANAALAAAMLVVAGVEPDAVVSGLSAARAVPGRMEPVDAGQGFVALVDYAHTPDALSSALASVRPVGGRLLVVLGCGGDRDVAKREPMGETAAALADVVVVTDDNPRSEDPGVIRASVLRGAAVGASGRGGDSRPVVHEEPDRGTAIAWAVARARAGDVVVVTGKGHETGQEVDGVIHPFDDRAVLAAALGAAALGAAALGAAAREAGEADHERPGQDTPRTGVHRAPDNPEDRA